MYGHAMRENCAAQVPFGNSDRLSNASRMRCTRHLLTENARDIAGARTKLKDKDGLIGCLLFKRTAREFGRYRASLRWPSTLVALAACRY